MLYTLYQFPLRVVCLCRDLRRPLIQEMFVFSPSFFFQCFFNFNKISCILRYNFCDLDIGCSNVSTKDKILSVGPSQLKMIGLVVMVGF